MAELEKISQLLSLNDKLLSQCNKGIGAINKILLGAGKPDGYKTGTSYLDADMIKGSRAELHSDIIQRLVEEKYLLEQIAEEQEAMIETLETQLQMLSSLYKDSSQLEHQIAYLRFEENLTLKEVADKLGYSYDYIRQVSSKMLRKVTKASLKQQL